MANATKRVLQFVVFGAKLLLAAIYVSMVIFGVLLLCFPKVLTLRICNDCNQSDLTSSRAISSYLMDNSQKIASALLFTGILLSLVSIVGFAAITTNCVWLYKLYLLTICAFSLLLAILLLIMFFDREMFIRNFQRVLQNEINGNSNNHIGLGAVMTSSGCCGINNYTDFNVQLSEDLPQTCCKYENATDKCKCTAELAEASAIPGCKRKIRPFLVEACKIVSIILILLFILSTQLSIALMYAFRKCEAIHLQIFRRKPCYLQNLPEVNVCGTA